jgi:hypothetical protein
MLPRTAPRGLDNLVIMFDQLADAIARDTARSGLP